MYKRAIKNKPSCVYSVRALQSIHLFSPLLKRGQFHVYPTAQAQNSAPRIFAFLTYQSYQDLNALLNLQLLLVFIVAEMPAVRVSDQAKLLPVKTSNLPDNCLMTYYYLHA